MAYTVGSASVEIVPDFRNAQNTITAFFAKQREEMRVPVKLLIDKDNSGSVERDAQTLGKRTGEAMNRGVAQSQAAADREAIQAAKARERAILQAHAEAHRENDRMNRAAEKALLQAHAEAIRENDRMNREAARSAKANLDAETKTRIEAEREAVRLAQGEQKAFQQAHTEALRLNAQMDRERSRAAQQAMREAQRLADERVRIDAEAERIMQRTRQQVMREEETFAQRSGRAIQQAFSRAAREEARQNKLRIPVDEEDSRRGGRRVGGLVVNAAREEIRQNAGLITAVIAGILIAGAPALLGAASILFAGVGAVAAFQSDRLRQTWIGLWDEIKSGAQSDSAILIPAYSRMAATIGQSFQKMRPMIRDAFTSVAPQIDTFSASLGHTAENVLPGLVRAVKVSGPVIEGLGAMFEKTGTGLSNFFTVLSKHAVGAGAAASSLGDAVAALLPTLGELLGQGAETASVVLPMLTSAFNVLHSVVAKLGSSMPAVFTAFLAFRGVQGVGRIIAGWSTSLTAASKAGGAFSAVQGKMGSALGVVGKAVPAVAIAFAGYGAMLAQEEQQTQKFTQVILQGGTALQALKAKIDEVKSMPNHDLFGQGPGEALQEQYNKAQKAADAYLKSLTPLELANHNVDVASRNLAKTLGDESSTAADLEGAKRALGRATATQTREEEALERATRGVTQAMQDQADQARARVDANFGMQKAILDTKEAQQKLKETLADSKSTTLDVDKATLDYNESLLAQAEAAGAVATSDLPAAMSDQQKSIIGAKGSLDELNRMIASGIKLPPSMEAYRQKLIQITGGADTATLEQAQLSAALQEVGASVEAIPGTATIEIHDPSPAIIQRLHDLGFDILNLPNGDVRVTAVTDEAKANIGNLSTDLTNLNAQKVNPTITINDSRFKATHTVSMQALNQLNNQHPSPTVSIKDKATGPTRTAISLVDLFGGKNKSATVGIIDHASNTLQSIFNKLSSIASKTVTVTVVNRQTTANLATGGAVEDAMAGVAGSRSAAIPRYDVGGHYYSGAIVGRGGPTDDLNLIAASNGEHMLDGLDVALLGGQAGTYRFRQMLNAGMFGNAGTGGGIQKMLAMGTTGRQAAPSGGNRNFSIYTSDNPRAIIQAISAYEHQQSALASVWP